MPADPSIDPLTNREIDFLVGEAGGCENCGDTQGVDAEDSRTLYPWEGEEGAWDDPNRSVKLCRSCAGEHHSWWDSQWAEYNASRG